MLAWIYRVLIGDFKKKSCDHYWETIHENTIYNGDSAKGLPIGTKYTLKCEHCGEMKVFKTY